MRRQSFSAWRVPEELSAVLLLEDQAVTGGRFTSSERHFHDELEIHFVERGRVTFLLSEGRLLAGPGTLLVIPPRRDHVVIETSKDARRWMLLSRSRAARAVLPRDGQDLFLGRAARERHAVLRARDALSLRQTLREIHDERGEAASLRNAALSFVLARAFSLFLRAGESPELAALSPAVERAVELLRAGDRPSLGALARSVGMSEAHLSKLFSAELGTSITDYRNRVALERFVDVYGDGTRASLLEAALDAGFGSYPQFHRVFKKHFGYGPAEHRARASGKPGGRGGRPAKNARGSMQTRA
ncbi:MAG TPA: AraC family transcriptional regulator [Polyangiaceae bacterium]|nr:AraC family transcriptional regulator [Polyangiaceae bacterium]